MKTQNKKKSIVIFTDTRKFYKKKKEKQCLHHYIDDELRNQHRFLIRIISILQYNTSSLPDEMTLQFSYYYYILRR